MPFRRLLAIFTGSSAAPVGSTAGGAGALAVKLVTLGAVGTAAVGVSVNELGTDTWQHALPTPATQPAPSRVQHFARTTRPYAATTFIRFHTPVAPSGTDRGKKHAAHAGAASVTGSTSMAAPATIPFTWVPSAPAEIAAPTTPAADDPPQDNQPETAPAPDSSSDPDTASTAAPEVPGSSDASAPDAPSSAPTQADAASAPAADATPATTTTATTPSSPTQTTGHGNGVGPGGNPPAHTPTKPDVARGGP